MLKLSRVALAGAFAVCCAGQGQAQSYQVTGYGFDPAALISTIQHTPSGLTLDVYTGRLKLTAQEVPSNAPAEFLTFCVDIFHPLQTGPFAVAPIGTLVSNATKQNQLLALMGRANALIAGASDKSLAAAAMQLAVWEVVNEEAATYDFGAGSFRAYGWNTDGARTVAETWLGKVTSGTWAPPVNGRLTLLYSANSQSQLVSAVPEPATWAALISGFALAGAAARRRRAVAPPVLA